MKPKQVYTWTFWASNDLIALLLGLMKAFGTILYKFVGNKFSTALAEIRTRNPPWNRQNLDALTHSATVGEGSVGAKSDLCNQLQVKRKERECKKGKGNCAEG